jgi:hypothetical protein
LFFIFLTFPRIHAIKIWTSFNQILIVLDYIQETNINFFVCFNSKDIELSFYCYFDLINILQKKTILDDGYLVRNLEIHWFLVQFFRFFFLSV